MRTRLGKGEPHKRLAGVRLARRSRRLSMRTPDAQLLGPGIAAGTCTASTSLRSAEPEDQRNRILRLMIMVLSLILGTFHLRTAPSTALWRRSVYSPSLLSV